MLSSVTAFNEGGNEIGCMFDDVCGRDEAWSASLLSFSFLPSRGSLNSFIPVIDYGGEKETERETTHRRQS